MDKMPPRPDPFTTSAFPIDGVWLDVELYDSNQMHAYARAYAEQRCAPLVEALNEVRSWSRRDRWSEEIWQVDLQRVIAALAAEQEHSNG